MTLYFAYGSNINVEQMKRRAPGAVVVLALELKGWELVFRGVADIVPKRGSSVHGLIWRLTPEDEDALDAFEGIDPRRPFLGVYRKERIRLPEPIDGEWFALVYVMNSEGIFPPYGVYLRTILGGYARFDFPIKRLRKALHFAHDALAPSDVERSRYRRQGRPRIVPRDALDKPKGKEPAKPAKRLAETGDGRLFDLARSDVAASRRPTSEPAKGSVRVSSGNWMRNLVVHGD